MPCSSVNSTVLPTFSTNPTLHCPMGLHHLQLQKLSHPFLQDALRDSSIIAKKKKLSQHKEASGFNYISTSFHGKYYPKITDKKTKYGFSPSYDISLNHTSTTFSTLNVILTFDSILCKFASQMIFLHSSVLQTFP